MTTLSIWTVYDRPKDCPDAFIARRSEAGGGKVVMTDETIVSKNLDFIRRQMQRRGLVKLMRAPADDPKIVEVWL